MPKFNSPIIANIHGLTVETLNNGSIGNIQVNTVRVGLKPAHPIGSSGANIYLRKHGQDISFKPLLGPTSNSRFFSGEHSFTATGSWEGLDYNCILDLSKDSSSWQWRVDITNKEANLIGLDVIYVQDVGLQPIDQGSCNEYYVSQYLERRVLKHKDRGAVICCRQNIRGDTGNPWLMLTSNAAASACVDGMQFYGSHFRETGIPKSLLERFLGGEYSGESSVLALQESPFTLAKNEMHSCVFTALYISDHPEATSEKDLEKIPSLLSQFSQGQNFTDLNKEQTVITTLFDTTPFLPIEDLSEPEIDHLFGKERRHREEVDGQLLSFFNQRNHVVLRAKEALVERPHGHIMQAQSGLVPDENIVTTTAYMYGVFNSHVTQGNTNFNRLVSVCSSQFNLESYTGQRIFVELENQTYKLGVPSLFEIGQNHCRWIYKHGSHWFEIRTWTSKTADRINTDFKLLKGGPVNLLITVNFDDSNQWAINPGVSSQEIITKPGMTSKMAEKFPQACFRIQWDSDGRHSIKGDELLYSDHQRRSNSFIVIQATCVSHFCLSFIGEMQTPKTIPSPMRSGYTDEHFQRDVEDGVKSWQSLSSHLKLHGSQQDWEAIQETLPWYGANAMIHYLTPHGLEQFDGAAWGTRDTAQGPIELLLATGKFKAAKQVLRILFSNQNSDGGWPQWWMFDSYSEVRASSSHADIHHWCLIALSDYIKTTNDIDFLNEVLPYYDNGSSPENKATPIEEHVNRLIDMLTNSFLEGTHLVTFGGGDWNDSMQPKSPELAQKMISTWTVALNYQAFKTYQQVCDQFGLHEQAQKLQLLCQSIKQDFNQYLVKDGVVSGHGLLEKDGNIDLLLHPSDSKTGIQYRLLPMMRSIISGIFTSEQTQNHLALIEKHLKGPDGARLMNRPPKYHGGVQTFFQRAESSSFFGREVGIMYTHAHLRYAEVQARVGNADNLIKALRQATPVAYRDIVPCGNIRQANCYFSSSDISFRTRYEADEMYADVIAGKITTKGGWRVYSSGPGIYIGLIISRLLGLRTVFEQTIIDPVISKNLDGMSATIEYFGKRIKFIYQVESDCFGPKTIIINNTPIAFERQRNSYREGGAVLSTKQFLSALNQKNNTIQIRL